MLNPQAYRCQRDAQVTLSAYKRPLSFCPLGQCCGLGFAAEEKCLLSRRSRGTKRYPKHTYFPFTPQILAPANVRTHCYQPLHVGSFVPLPCCVCVCVPVQSVILPISCLTVTICLTDLDNRDSCFFHSLVLLSHFSSHIYPVHMNTLGQPYIYVPVPKSEFTSLLVLVGMYASLTLFCLATMA